jgi:hypothetical protein
MSRSSVYETIEEEASVAMTLSPPTARLATIISAGASPSQDSEGDFTMTCGNISIPANISGIDAALANACVSTASHRVQIVDSDGDSPRSSGEWDPQHGLSLRRYYALRSEAHDTVEESKLVWPDTPFSTFAVQGMR